MVLPILPTPSETVESTELLGIITADDVVLAVLVLIIGCIVIRVMSSTLEKYVAKKIKKALQVNFTSKRITPAIMLLMASGSS